MATRYVDSVDGSDSNAGTSIGAAWKTIPKVYTSATSGDTIDIMGSTNEASPRMIPFGYDWFYNDGKKNNLTFRNYGDTHIAMDVRGRGNSHSGMTWERWTAGGIEVQGAGSVRLGPMDPNYSLDANYRFGIIQATGCTGLRFDGGPNKKLLINGGGCDVGIYFINYPSVGCGDIIVENYTGTTDATGILIRSNGTDTTPGLGGLITLQDFVDHGRHIMLDDRGTSGDVGAQAIGIEFHTAGVLIQRAVSYDNFAPSPAFGWDGGFLNPFGAPNVTVQDCEIYDTPGMIESGRGSLKPYCDNMVIRRNVFRGRTNPFNKNPPTDPGLLLRDSRDGIVENNTFYISTATLDDYYEISIYEGSGQFVGITDRLKVRNNIFVLLHDNARGMLQVADNAPGANAYTIDYNLYYRPNGGTLVGNSATWAQWPGQLASMGVVGAESHGMYANPLFTDAANGDFTLQAGSPAIGAGWDGSDLGAFQYAATDVTATPGVKALTTTKYAPSVSASNTAVSTVLTKPFGHRGRSRKIRG